MGEGDDAAAETGAVLGGVGCRRCTSSNMEETIFFDSS